VICIVQQDVTLLKAIERIERLPFGGCGFERCDINQLVHKLHSADMLGACLQEITSTTNFL
jgi:hypothetical protein